jgi:hypothetical protein
MSANDDLDPTSVGPNPDLRSLDRPRQSPLVQLVKGTR